MQTSKPAALKSPSIRKTVQTNIVQKLKNKTTSTITSKIIAKPISTKTTSDLKLQQQSTSTKIPIVNYPETPSNTDNSKQSFASTVANSLIPKKDQAIVIDINVSLPHKDYVIAIGKLVQPSNILFASRISKERICIFLSSKTLVDNLIENHPSILIQEQHFKLRKLYNPNKRVILSNVYPNIPPDVIANEFAKLNISLCSPITFLKAGIQVEDFTHILSFRRQTFIKHEDLSKIPTSILINYEDTNYRIFLSDDSLNCFICQSQGHIASQCTNQNISSSKISNENNAILDLNITSKLDVSLNKDNTPTEVHPSSAPTTPLLEPLKILSEPPPQYNPPATTSTPTLIELQDLESTPNTDITEMDLDQPCGTKRSLPDSFYTQSAPSSPMDLAQETNEMRAPSNWETPQIKTLEKKKKNKKTKSASLKKFLENIDTYLEPTQHLFNDLNSFKIDYDTFKHILENNQGPFDPPSIYNEYNISKEELLDIISKIKPCLRDNSIKNRITRFTKILNAEPYDSNESEA